jgi:hypothetical protein
MNMPNDINGALCCSPGPGGCSNHAQLPSSTAATTAPTIAAFPYVLLTAAPWPAKLRPGACSQTVAAPPATPRPTAHGPISSQVHNHSPMIGHSITPCLPPSPRLLPWPHQPTETHRDIVVYLDKKDGKPLGSGSVDAAAVSRWTDKIHAWDGNLFVAANGSPGEWGLGPVGHLVGAERGALRKRGSRSSGSNSTHEPGPASRAIACQQSDCCRLSGIRRLTLSHLQAPKCCLPLS